MMSICDVGFDSVVEEERLLLNDRDLLSVLLQIVLSDIDAVKSD